MSEYLNLSDETLDRLTDGELFRQGKVDVAGCHCGMRFVALDHMIDFMTELSESCISDQKQEAYFGLRDVLRIWRDEPPGG